MDIRISLRQTLSGATLATVRCITTDEVVWHRVTLPSGTDLGQVQRDVIRQTLEHLRRHGGPAGKLVMFQLALPGGG